MHLSELPALERESGSWVATSPAGRVVELFERRNAEKALRAGWLIETALACLVRVNREIRDTSSVAVSRMGRR